MNELESYTLANFSDEINAVESSSRKDLLPELSKYEKALIYKYSDDGFRDINEELRSSKGRKISEFAKYLK